MTATRKSVGATHASPASEASSTIGAPTAAPAPSRIAGTFARCKAAGRTAFMPFVTGGYPNLAVCEELVPALVAGGADLLELGVPFSDPIADGPTVQRTSQRALANGTTLDDCLDLVRRLREHHNVQIPIVLMGYLNPFLQYGLERLAATSAGVGVDGFIVPDLPTEESDEFVAACHRHGRDLIFMLAPTSTEARIHEVAARASGFIYCVSLIGVTGARDHLAPELAAYIGRIRMATDLPLAIGFGISRPEHVAQAGALADGVVVASALINHLDQFPEAEQPAEATAFARWLRGSRAVEQSSRDRSSGGE